MTQDLPATNSDQPEAIEEIWEREIKAGLNYEEMNLLSIAQEVKRGQSDIKFSDKWVTSCPGLVGEISEWITNSSYNPQPELSLAVSLVVMGVLKGHRVQTETGLRSNLYCLGVAPAGSGKGHPMKAWTRLLDSSNQTQIRCGHPSSGASIETILQKKGGRALILWDEIGLHIQAAFNSRSSSHEQKVIPTLLSLFSASDTLYYGRELADQKINPPVLIDQPCLGVFGATTPETLYSALTNNSVSSGFLPRWLIFPVNNPDAEVTDPLEDVNHIPPKFIEAIQEIVKMSTNNSRAWGGDLTIQPKTVRFSDEARELINPIRARFNLLKVLERKRGLGLDAIWARGWEQTCKVALTICNDEEITDMDLIWAYTMVEESFQLSVTMFEKNTHETTIERDLKRIHDYIIKNPGITAKKVLRKFHMKAYDFHQLANTLVERGDIHEFIETGYQNKKVKKYYAISN